MTRGIPFAGLPANDWRSRAADVIPGGSSTGSRRPDVLYGSRAFDAAVPTHYERAEGCYLWSPDGRRFIDCGMALGAVGIGYADSAITRAVIDAASRGNVSALPHRLEVEVAERLVQVIPSAEQVRFLRTGAEANAAAIRMARALTGREHVVACGYFGWLDWCSDAAGVPASTQQAVTWVPFNDIEALKTAVSELAAPPAAIIIEPLVHDLASASWLDAARRLADRTGAVLIFDEVKTAFRVRTGGVQALTGVTPDLTTLGKAMANGYPLAAVVGRAGVMDVAQRTWISSTAATESTGLAAAKAVLEWHERTDVPERMATAGGMLLQIIGTALSESPWVGVRAEGPPMMWRLLAEAPDALDALVAVAARYGLLLKRGAYQFGAIAHDEVALQQVAHLMPPIMQSLLPGPRRVED